MARPKDQGAARELGDALTPLYEAAGSPSYRTIERVLWKHLGDLAPSADWIRNAHLGGIDPYTADMVAASALAQFYGVTLEDLHPILDLRASLFVKRWDGSEEPFVERRNQASADTGDRHAGRSHGRKRGKSGAATDGDSSRKLARDYHFTPDLELCRS